jgi:hypothetical protein
MTSKKMFAIAGGVAVAAATAIAIPSAAGAAPTRGEEFTVTCPGQDPFTIVTPGGGSFTPAFIAGTTQLLIPYQITGVALVPGEEPQTFEEVKKAPVPDDAVTCTFEGSFTTPEGGTVTVSGTVVAVLRGH